MPRRQKPLRIAATAARWPVGVGWTAFRYVWRITPVHRWEMAGSVAKDSGPALPPGTDTAEVLHVEEGAGPLIHRLYRARIDGPELGPHDLMRCIQGDLDRVAPTELASFEKLHGERDRMAVGDEYVVRMPGPWDGPVQVVAVSPTSFRLATLEGHLEAGQIEFRVSADHRSLEFTIESWARSGDRLSDLMYSHLRIAKEIQLHMWTSVLERIVALACGTLAGGIRVITKRVETASGERESDRGPDDSRARRRLDELAGRAVTVARAPTPEEVAADGWHLDDMTERMPSDASGDPIENGTFEVMKELMVSYQVADPAVVRATFAPGAPLAGRDMLLQIRFFGLRFNVGVRIGDVYDETREVNGQAARVFGWEYTTLEGHFEEGRMHYEAWKWLESGDVEFRLRAFSRPARAGPLIPRLGFRLIGRRQQLAFYREVCRRIRRLTEAELELRGSHAKEALR